MVEFYCRLQDMGLCFCKIGSPSDKPSGATMIQLDPPVYKCDQPKTVSDRRNIVCDKKDINQSMGSIW